MIYLTHKLDEVLKEQGSSVCVNAFNPGFMVSTGFSEGHADKARALAVKTTMPDRYGELESSSDALTEAAVSDKYDGVSGKYFDRGFGIKDSSELSYNKENAEELWVKSIGFCGLKS
ncbi:MAG: hypothetical protein K6A40_09980 [Solobacterium sp.]|nr:hypothetical protein [Solobacterium sp.]